MKPGLCAQMHDVRNCVMVSGRESYWGVELSETGILKSEPETKKFSDLIEKHICDRQTQNLRFRDPLVGCARF